MLPTEAFVDLSRWQFALTTLYHFIFVPLTLGLSWILFIMESVYVMTGKQIYKDMTRFWGKLFGINFALGVTTGITMEFQFGTNWAYYSHYVGDIFGAPLAIEGLMAFFLESTFVGLFFFGWDRLSKRAHLAVTFLVALGANLSALWILIANAWMQNPVGAQFNFETMRMELASFKDLFFNPVAQVKFVHTVGAGYVAASIFVLAVSSYYLAQRPGSGFCAALLCGGEPDSDWHRSCPSSCWGIKPAMWSARFRRLSWPPWRPNGRPSRRRAISPCSAFRIRKRRKPSPKLKYPGSEESSLPGRLIHRCPGCKDLIADNEQRIRSGMIAYDMLGKLRQGDQSAQNKLLFDQNKENLGYGLLLKRYTPEVVDASDQQIRQAAQNTIPNVAAMFWSFRIMVGLGFYMLALIATSFYFCATRAFDQKRWLLKTLFYSLPVPWIAIELGWFVAEYGRQPWTIGGVLPTFLSASSLTSGDIIGSLIAVIALYTVFLIVEMYLMTKFVRLGPSSLHTGRYYFEQGETT